MRERSKHEPLQMRVTLDGAENSPARAAVILRNGTSKSKCNENKTGERQRLYRDHGDCLYSFQGFAPPAGRTTRIPAAFYWWSPRGARASTRGTRRKAHDPVF